MGPLCSVGGLGEAGPPPGPLWVGSRLRGSGNRGIVKKRRINGKEDNHQFFLSKGLILCSFLF